MKPENECNITPSIEKLFCSNPWIGSWQLGVILSRVQRGSTVWFHGIWDCKEASIHIDLSAVCLMGTWRRQVTHTQCAKTASKWVCMCGLQQVPNDIFLYPSLHKTINCHWLKNTIPARWLAEGIWGSCLNDKCMKNTDRTAGHFILTFAFFNILALRKHN